MNCPTPGIHEAAGTFRCEKHLFDRQNQAILPSNGSPPGGCGRSDIPALISRAGCNSADTGTQNPKAMGFRGRTPMSNQYIVAYDGSPAAQRAVDYAVERSKTSGAAILIAHVLEWSPYSFLTQEELAERHMRRTEELARAKSAIVDPVVASPRQPIRLRGTRAGAPRGHPDPALLHVYSTAGHRRPCHHHPRRDPERPSLHHAVVGVARRTVQA